MRILIRKQKAQTYLQPDGEWRPARETAREFVHVEAACLWAQEQKLLGVEILLAFDDPNYDSVPMRL